VSLPRTPSQTVGPFFTIGLCRRPENELDPKGTMLAGVLYDGNGDAVRDGVIELWDAESRRFGRCGTDAAGTFTFRIRPDADALDGHVFARGLLKHQRFRIPVRELARDDDGGTVFDIRLQGDGATTFYET